MLILKPFTEDQGRSMLHFRSHLRSLSLRTWVCHPHTRTHVRLLGPCFKTGRLKPFCQPTTMPRQRAQVSQATNPAHLEPRHERSLTRTSESAPADTQPGGGVSSLTQGIPLADFTDAKLAPNASLPTISSTF